MPPFTDDQRRLVEMMAPRLGRVVDAALRREQRTRDQQEPRTAAPGGCDLRIVFSLAIVCSAFSPRTRPRSVRGLRDAARWLSNFHRCTQLARAPWDSEQTRDWVTTPTDVYRRTFGETEGEHCLFERAQGYAASTAGLQLPLVRQHRDFRPVNILRNKSGEIAVVDWEGYRAGPAFCDLFHFLFQWHPSARRQEHQTIVNSIEQLLFEPTEDTIGDVIHEVVATYLSELRLHSALVPLLILYTLLELATRLGEQQERESLARIVGVTTKISNSLPSSPVAATNSSAQRGRARCWGDCPRSRNLNRSTALCV